MHGLVVADALGLIYRLAADDERADAELLRGGLVRRLAEYGLAELRQRRGKNIADVRHCYLLIMRRNWADVSAHRTLGAPLREAGTALAVTEGSPAFGLEQSRKERAE